MKINIFLGLTLVLVLLMPTVSLSVNAQSASPYSGSNIPAAPKGDYVINAGGATFPFPLIDKWRVEYGNKYPTTLNYQAIGSGAGIKLFTTKKVDFAASDAPLQAADIVKAPKGTLHIPETMGSVVITYNLPGVQKNGILLTGDVLAKIFMGQISTWSDDAIVKLQTDPDIAKALKNDRNKIILVHRSDGSGTTFAFTSYLSQVSSEWHNKIGKGTSVPWETGMGGSGNAGVAAIVKKVPDSMGYVELAYAKGNKLASGIPMTYAYIQNHDKTAFLDATTETMAAAAEGAISSLPESDGVWSDVSINDAPGPNSYPITTFTYLLVNPNLEQVKGMNKEKAQDIVHMLYWFVTEGQKYSKDLLYVPLPSAVQEIDKRGISKIKFNGEQLWSYNQGTPSKTDTGSSYNIPSNTSTTQSIPSWIKSNAKYWSAGQLEDIDFMKGLQYLIQNGVIHVPSTAVAQESSQQIPKWVKNSASMWSSGQISDDEFIKSVQYLVSTGIIQT